MEIWKDIEDHPGYQVSNQGNVRSRVNNRHGLKDEYHEIRPYTRKYGYKSVHLGRNFNESVHRLVAKAFIPNPEKLPLVRHLDDNPSNNRVENLAWGTQTDNMQDCVAHGRLVGDTSAAIAATKKPIKAVNKKDNSIVKEYGCIHDAAKDLGVWPQHISSVLQGKISQTGGWIFYEKGDGHMGQTMNAFPGYEFLYSDEDKKYHNMYRGVDIGFGGYIVSNPGVYGNIALLDVQSEHPNSAVQLNVFGKYTKNFEDLLHARIFIKHGDYESAKKLFDGKLAKYLDDPEQAGALAQALKIAINSVYGLTSAKFDNPFRDPRNVNNIVALRGALFMKTLQDEVEKRGFQIVAIKTDSIKIADATDEIINYCMDFANQYGYTFEHEATYDRMCQINDADYIAKYKDCDWCQEKYGYVPGDNKKHPGEWTATGARFAVPYVYKTLFTHEETVFEDTCETKTVKTALYLDMNENLPDVSGYENEMDKLETKYKKGLLSDTDFEKLAAELAEKIAEGHGYHFVGKVGQFCPIRPGKGGGVLLREKDGKYGAVTGTKGYRWLESEMVKQLGKEGDIDLSYYENLVDEARNAITVYGDFTWFVSDDPYIGPSFEKGEYMDKPCYEEELPWS